MNNVWQKLQVNCESGLCLFIYQTILKQYQEEPTESLTYLPNAPFLYLLKTPENLTRF